MIIAFFLRGSKKKKRFIIIYVLFVVVGLPRLVAANSVSINQLSYYFDNSTNNYEYTGWGAVDFAYTGVSGNVGYFNLWLDGVADPMDAWQVRNMPVESIEGAGVSDSIRYCFDLQGDEYNNNISGHYAFSTNVETEAPTGTAFTTTVGHDSALMNAGLTEDQMKISTMATVAATGWTSTGCPTATWFNTKDKYMKDNKYGVTTRKITDLVDLITEIDSDQDIELVYTWTKDGKKSAHCVSVVGIEKLKDGKYAVTIVDDLKQGVAGGLSKRTYTIDQMGVMNCEGFGLRNFEYAIVECPEPATICLLALGGLLLRRRKST